MFFCRLRAEALLFPCFKRSRAHLRNRILSYFHRYVYQSSNLISISKYWKYQTVLFLTIYLKKKKKDFLRVRFAQLFYRITARSAGCIYQVLLSGACWSAFISLQTLARAHKEQVTILSLQIRSTIQQSSFYEIYINIKKYIVEISNSAFSIETTLVSVDFLH